jgi:hypothetical protein
MYDDNTSAPNNLAKALDTPESPLDIPYLSDFLNELTELPSNNRKAHFEALAATKEWLLSLPASLSTIERKKRERLGAFLDSALAKCGSNE